MNMKTIIYYLIFLSSFGYQHIPDTIEYLDINASNHVKSNYEVKITITHYFPYCGGPVPSQEMLDNQTQLQANTEFILIHKKTGRESKVQTDSLGVLNLNLPIGQYAIKELYKDCTFETFLKKYHQPSQGNYTPSPEEGCYKKWWKSYLGEFTVSSSNTTYNFNFGSRAACFTGLNPCIYYNGPWPP